MLFGKTALPYFRFGDDGAICYVILCMKMQKIMITSHIPPPCVPAQTTLDRTTFHRRGYVAVSLQTCNWECGVRILDEGRAFSVLPKTCWLNSCFRLGMLPHKLFSFFIRQSSIQSHTGWTKSATSVGPATHFSFTTFFTIQLTSLRCYWMLPWRQLSHSTNCAVVSVCKICFNCLQFPCLLMRVCK
jgi:hypothetical protein